MSIEFDDAGGGCPILGEAFVAHRIETGEVYYGYVQNNEKNQSDVLMELLNKISPQENEPIYICQGNVFNSFANTLKKKNLNVQRVKIIGETNDLVESYFNNLLLDIGMPKSIKLENKNYGEFYASIFIWYKTFYNGEENLLKESFVTLKRDFRNYLHYSVLSYPNLLKQLFY